jgi:serine/threonine-protein kinase
MREELRASLVKPFYLALREGRGEPAAREAIADADLESSYVELETSWLSVEAAHRFLACVNEELGAEGMARAASFVAHTEALGTWVRMVRESKQPLDAFRWLAKNAVEQTRVGEYELLAPAEGAPLPEGGVREVRMAYRLRPDEPGEPDDLLCTMRAQQLAGLPGLWGLPAAEITHEGCLAKGGDSCVYVVRWHDASPRDHRTFAYAGGAAAAALAAVAPFGRVIPAVLAAAIAGGLGYGLGTMLGRNRAVERDRAFERTRIAALERSLELRGDGPTSIATGDLPGTVLGGKYRIGKRIGSGGIGVVHQAEHITLGTQVAIKVLRGAAAKDGAEIARLRREAQVASALDHPNVVKVLDLDQLGDGSIYVVMELLRGRSLAERLHRDGPLAPGQAIQIFRQVSLALQAAHDIGVVHRDLKPGNVFLLDDGETAKVLDFGMSKLSAGLTVGGGEKLTQDGYTLGTPEYMAPEQCIGATVEARTDLYGLGVLMYEALTGDLPIKSQNRRELLDLHQRQIPPPMRQRRPDLPIPRELDEAVAACLRKRISERPASASAFEEMLAAVPLEGVPMYYPRNVGRHPPRQRTKEGGDDPRPTQRARSR